MDWRPSTLTAIYWRISHRRRLAYARSFFCGHPSSRKRFLYSAVIRVWFNIILFRESCFTGVTIVGSSREKMRSVWRHCRGEEHLDAAPPSCVCVLIKENRLTYVTAKVTWSSCFLAAAITTAASIGLFDRHLSRRRQRYSIVRRPAVVRRHQIVF